MKIVVLLLTLFFSLSQASAQFPKVIVRFKDKGSNTFSIASPSQFLSPRALQRRTRFNIPIDSTDLPITKRYIDSVNMSGNVIILSQSKWLNQILIQTTDQAALTKIRSLPFVNVVAGVGYRLANVEKKKIDKREVITPLLATEKVNRVAANVFDYGNAYNQVHLHEGEFLHNKGYRGEGIQITVLDAGFFQYKNVTAFDSIRLNGQLLAEKDFVAFDNSMNEDDPHGMYCLSTMAANWPGRMVGSAPKASYYLLRTENAFSEYPIEEHNWVAGSEFADSTGADIISSSLGYYEFDEPQFNHTYDELYKNSAPVSKGATMAAKKGLIVMNSAGNNGNDSWKYINFPADADSVCAVGAVNASGQIASFSSYGYPGKVKPNIVSVGAGTVIAGLNNQPASGSGTSFSNPNVAGLVACLWQAFPQYNNMKILEAVYKSSDRYNNPDNRYGFGIPNFRIAYRLLKKEQNNALFGNEWLAASPNPFNTNIEVRFVGQVDGNAKVELINPKGEVIASKNLVTEIEEVFAHSFNNLQNLVAGTYIVRYTDSLNTRSINVQKFPSFIDNWLVAAPNPFNNNLIISFKAPESGKAMLRLIDAKGSKVAELALSVVMNEAQTVNFPNINKLGKGVYLLQYIGSNNSKTLKLLKQ